MLVLLAHTVDIISYEVNGLAERVSALTQDLDSFFHEFNVLFIECTRWAWVDIPHSHASKLFRVRLLATSITLTCCSSFFTLFALANLTHLDFWSAVLFSFLATVVFLLFHFLESFLNNCTMLPTPVNHGHSHASVFFRFFLLFLGFVFLTVSDQVLLLLLLLPRSHGSLLGSLFTLHLFHLLPLSFLLFLLDTTTLLFFPSAFSFLLLLSFGLCLLCLSLSFLSGHGLRLSLSFCLGPRFCFSEFLLVHSFILWLLSLFLATNTKHLLDMRSRVDT